MLLTFSLCLSFSFSFDDDDDDGDDYDDECGRFIIKSNPIKSNQSLKLRRKVIGFYFLITKLNFFLGTM